MKYKVGDKVRVKKDLVADRIYGYVVFVNDMEKYCGKTVTIKSITESGRYKLEEDSAKRYWTDEMLEDVANINIFIDGNKVIAKKGNKAGIARCSPEDEFDIFTGARLAIDRLEEKCNPYCWLKYGVRYYVPSFLHSNFYVSYTYRDDPTDIKIKECGLVFKTEEEAVAAAKKMLAVLKEGEDDGEL